MKTHLFSLVLLGSLLGGCARAYNDPQQLPPAPGTASGRSQGALLFETACASCHGQDARGLPGRGVSLHGLKMSESELLERIRLGKAGHMPAKGGYPVLTEAQLRLLAGYLRSLSL